MEIVGRGSGGGGFYSSWLDCFGWMFFILAIGARDFDVFNEVVFLEFV